VIIVYIGLCVGGMVFFRRIRDRYSVGRAPVGAGRRRGAVRCGVVWLGLPAPTAPLSFTPYITVAVVLVGVVVVVFLRIRRPEAVQRIGTILGEEGRESAAVSPQVRGPRESQDHL